MGEWQWECGNGRFWITPNISTTNLRAQLLFAKLVSRMMPAIAIRYSTKVGISDFCLAKLTVFQLLPNLIRKLASVFGG
jgi:hypothetical protein